MFKNNIFAKEYVFAVTGALHGKKNETLEKYLNDIVEDIVRMSKGKARVDQIFVYNRKSQEGTATQTIQHDDVTLGEFYKETPHSMKMFLSRSYVQKKLKILIKILKCVRMAFVNWKYPTNSVYTIKKR